MKSILTFVLFIISFSVYGQDGQRESFLVCGLYGYSPFEIYVAVENNQITGFSLCDLRTGLGRISNNSIITFSSIELTVQDFGILKNALGKALEWDTIASQNDVDRFSKNLPYTISSNNVSWDISRGSSHTIKNGETLTLEFIFSWNPSLTEYERGALSINSNTINTSVSGSKETFQFSRRGSSGEIRRSLIEFLLEKLTDEKVQEAIAAGRIKKAEDEARKIRTETLFG
jgi:hypothetical protein